MDNVTIAGAAAVIWKLPLFSYTRKCLHFSLLPAPVPLHVVLFSKWSDGLDILVLGVLHWSLTGNGQCLCNCSAAGYLEIVIVLIHT